ncbi:MULTISPECIES: biotin--[acetyl-CoA-carboxylase] ligase [Sulfurovum]|uniref:Biotin--[acetyl-CoA-carboxylase] ligase n=1 Tax=Sulfurovum xiamenensis TaxID=3019066 RepID=A0ABT7QPR7_9BACT|nr:MULTISPECIES: biotin--[acetyl-CoA-carboxylase] ligase [Sulfurovum]EIF50847.1 biotin--protein ligase [Sulfurovum sp. AR]MDM5262777.1 biotin--[acetyl-CoA-carboxylase] ligase [Sulfurovum xiamenensis]
MEIVSFDTLASTQTYLLEQLKKQSVQAPLAVIANQQYSGIGSRDNSWSGGEGNFFASIAVNLEDLPKDLPLESASIYFSFIMKQTLEAHDENIWLKWPNDFYLNDEKIGGTITKKFKNTLVCGMGINLKDSQNGYRALECDISAQFLLEKYLLALEKFPKWKEVFREYEIEFELSRKFSVHIENDKKSLSDATLCADGSLMIEGKRVFSLR